MTSILGRNKRRQRSHLKTEAKTGLSAVTNFTVKGKEGFSPERVGWRGEGEGVWPC
jgi:hypothetical protein